MAVPIANHSSHGGEVQLSVPEWTVIAKRLQRDPSTLVLSRKIIDAINGGVTNANAVRIELVTRDIEIIDAALHRSV